jgi:hypothetical protein
MLMWYTLNGGHTGDTVALERLLCGRGRHDGGKRKRCVSGMSRRTQPLYMRGSHAFVIAREAEPEIARNVR